MELQAELIDVVRDIRSGGFRLALSMQRVPSEIDSLWGKPLRVSMKQWREKRSLTANGYYWVMVTKISEKLSEEGKEPISTTAVHNILLRGYGQIELVDGEPVTMFVLDTDEAYKKALNAETYHIKPTSHTKIGKDGRTYRAYRMLKGSSEYDTKEMARLIDGAVSEAKSMGIEVLPDEEIERMLSAYEVNHTNRQ